MVDNLYARKVSGSLKMNRQYPGSSFSRRLAAATGNPVGILDDNIATSLPTESPGFPPVAALNVNIQLAKITGQIIQGN